MPIYEFHCYNCKIDFETLLASSIDTNDVVCKRCNSKNIKKNISASTIRIGSSTSNMPEGGCGGCPSKSGFS